MCIQELFVEHLLSDRKERGHGFQALRASLVREKSDLRISVHSAALAATWINKFDSTNFDGYFISSNDYYGYYY